MSSVHTRRQLCSKYSDDSNYHELALRERDINIWNTLNGTVYYNQMNDNVIRCGQNQNHHWRWRIVKQRHIVSWTDSGCHFENHQLFGYNTVIGKRESEFTVGRYWRRSHHRKSFYRRKLVLSAPLPLASPDICSFSSSTLLFTCFFFFFTRSELAFVSLFHFFHCLVFIGESHESISILFICPALVCYIRTWWACDSHICTFSAGICVVIAVVQQQFFVNFCFVLSKCS